MEGNVGKTSVLFALRKGNKENNERNEGRREDRRRGCMMRRAKCVTAGSDTDVYVFGHVGDQQHAIVHAHLDPCRHSRIDSGPGRRRYDSHHYPCITIALVSSECECEFSGGLVDGWILDH